MKNQFQTPEVEVINFSVEDVVLVSGGLNNEQQGPGDEGDFGEMFG